MVMMMSYTVLMSGENGSQLELREQFQNGESATELAKNSGTDTVTAPMK